MLPITLDRDRANTLQEQIYRSIRDRIVDGTLAAGMRLPSSRELAGSLGVARNTATLAYEWLAAEGYIDRRSGAGSFVAADGIERPMATIPMPMPAQPPVCRPSFDFWFARPDQRLFPAHLWRSLGVKALGGCSRGLTEYGETGGDHALRHAIAGHLAQTRGVAAHADQVIVTSGAQEALNLAARVLIRPGEIAIVEAPGYDPAARVLEAQGARVIPQPLDGEGLDPAGLSGLRARLLHITPSHQFPTGTVMSLARRLSLIARCRQWDGMILEDDYDGDIVLDHPPVAPVAALDRLQRTILVGSFSRTLGNGLRLGYMVVPQPLVPAARAAKSLLSHGQSWLDQQILTAFLDGGHYRRHLRRLCVVYRQRREAAISGLHAVFGDGATLAGTGLHLLCTLPPACGEAAEVALQARAAGVGLYPAAACSVREGGTDLSRTLVVGFAALTPAEIAEAFRRVGRVVGRPARVRSAAENRPCPPPC